MAAQQRIFRAKGGTIVDGVGARVDRVSVSSAGGQDEEEVRVTTSLGKVLRGKKVLVATGGFTGFKPLLPSATVDSTKTRQEGPDAETHLPRTPCQRVHAVYKPMFFRRIL